MTLSQHHGMVLTVHAPLHGDGFAFYKEVPSDLWDTDLSTEDEVVLCHQCNQKFELTLVTV